MKKDLFNNINDQNRMKLMKIDDETQNSPKKNKGNCILVISN